MDGINHKYYLTIFVVKTEKNETNKKIKKTMS